MVILSHFQHVSRRFLAVLAKFHAFLILFEVLGDLSGLPKSLAGHWLRASRRVRGLPGATAQVRRGTRHRPRGIECERRFV